MVTLLWQGRVLPVALDHQYDPHASVGRALNCRRVATTESVFANIQHHKRMSRFTLRSKTN
jgi:hypothetical protein